MIGWREQRHASARRGATFRASQRALFAAAAAAELIDFFFLCLLRAGPNQSKGRPKVWPRRRKVGANVWLAQRAILKPGRGILLEPRAAPRRHASARLGSCSAAAAAANLFAAREAAGSLSTAPIVLWFFSPLLARCCLLFAGGVRNMAAFLTHRQPPQPNKVARIIN